MHDSRNRRFAAFGILGVAASMSCGESPTAVQRFGPPAALQVVTGRSQIGAAGQALPEPLTVQVLDAAGHGLQGLSVTWTVSGGGTLFARAVPTVTDSLGLVMVFWQLGPAFGNQQVIAHCCGFDAGFSALAQLPISQRVSYYGNGQQATVGQALTYPIVIQVLKADGTYDTGVPVEFRAISRGSTYSPADTVTDSQGHASTRWTLGTVAGVESTAVLVRGLPPVLVTAYAIAGPPVRVTITRRALPSLGGIGDSAWVTASAWDHYDNPISQFPTIGVADTMIAQVWYVTYNAIGVQARHHGATFVTAQLGAVRDSVPLTVLGFSGVSAGGHVCALSLAGDTYCWGENSQGTIGDGTRTDRSHPVLIGTGLGLQLPSTGTHTCALDPGGHAFCWGPDPSGELGDGSPDYANELRQTLPVAVAGGHVFTSIRTGRSHSCAVDTSGDAYCWGDNGIGQLGRDTLTNTCYLNAVNRCSNQPILVAGGLTFAQVSASPWEHSCGVTTGGAAYCWGSNGSGQLGTDSATDLCGYPTPWACSRVPVAVKGGIVFKSVSTGDYFTCGVSTVGDGYCWGYGYYGQLGNGAYSNSTSPVPVSGGLSFADIRSGGYSCGLTTGGKLYCWGGGYGAVPVPVRPDLVFASLALGAPSCAVTSDNDLYCW